MKVSLKTANLSAAILLVGATEAIQAANPVGNTVLENINKYANGEAAEITELKYLQQSRCWVDVKSLKVLLFNITQSEKAELEVIKLVKQFSKNKPLEVEVKPKKAEKAKTAKENIQAETNTEAQAETKAETNAETNAEAQTQPEKEPEPEGEPNGDTSVE